MALSPAALTLASASVKVRQREEAEPDALSSGTPDAIERTIAALAARFGNKLVTSDAVRRQHANTTTWLANEPPDAVVYAASTEDVQA